MWWLQDADPENNSRQASPSQESINQVSLGGAGWGAGWWRDGVCLLLGFKQDLPSLGGP
jgi:hypothetical protein